MPTKTAPLPKTDPYLELVRHFPLKPLKNDTTHAQAVEMVESLMGRELDSGASDYLDTLDSAGHQVRR